jgi:hypothetical protein
MRPAAGSACRAIRREHRLPGIGEELTVLALGRPRRSAGRRRRSCAHPLRRRRRLRVALGSAA